MPTVQVTVYCNRCDREFVGTGPTYAEAREAGLKIVDAHAKKHPDYSPSLHSEIDE